MPPRPRVNQSSLSQAAPTSDGLDDELQLHMVDLQRLPACVGANALASDAAIATALPAHFGFGFEAAEQKLSSYKLLQGGSFCVAKAPVQARFATSIWRDADVNVLRLPLLDWPQDEKRAPRPPAAAIPEVLF